MNHYTSDTLLSETGATVRTDRLLDRYTRPSPPSRERIETEYDTEPHDDHGAFGWLRGVRDRAIMLEIRRKDGQIKAFGYAWLQLAEYDPAGIITLSFPGSRVRLHGRNLNHAHGSGAKLFEGLLRHRVPYVQEADEHTHLTATATATIIERIEW